jgi:GT2 family glycosyltransferase
MKKIFGTIEMVRLPFFLGLMSMNECRSRSSAIRIVIVVLTYNQRERTVACLSSLDAAEIKSYPIVLWDNGSTDGTIEAVRAVFPDILVHYHSSNLGVASGRNAAAELAIKTFDPTHLLFLDNDMLVQPGFVDALAAAFRENPKLGQTQAKLRFMDDRQRLNDGGGARINFMLWKITPVGYREVDHGQYDTPKPCVSCGGAMMVRTDVFEELGGFDPIFDPFGPEDLDFSLRLQKAGYIALYVPQAVAYHIVSHTFGEGYSEDYARHKSRHWLLFMRRHASLMQKAGFYFCGAPYLVVRTLIREAARGNLKALRGIIRGMIDFRKS